MLYTLCLQIPEREGVRVFYAQFYGGQKIGEAISALLCIAYLSAWNSFSNGPPTLNYNGQADYLFLFYGWACSIAIASGFCLISLAIGKLVIFLTRTHPFEV